MNTELAPAVLRDAANSTLAQDGLDSTLGANNDSILGADNEVTRSTNSDPIRALNKPTTTFDAAAAQIVAHGEGLLSEKIPLTELRIEGNRLIAEDREFHLDHDGIRRLCGQLGAPPDYLGRLPIDLSSQALTHNLQSLGRAPKGLNDRSSHINHRDGKFLSLGRSDLRTLGSREVLNAVRDGFGTAATTFEVPVHGLDIQAEAFRLDIVSPMIGLEVRAGDVIQAGVRVEHSYTGDRATTVMAYVVRLVCTNGMVHRECLSSRTKKKKRTRRLDIGRDDAGMSQIEQVRTLTVEVREELDAKLAAIRQLADHRADEAQLKMFLNQARMGSKAVFDRLREAWAAEGNERTGFGLFNAMTRLATHGNEPAARELGLPELSNVQRAALARLAGIYANQSDHICPKCFSLMNTPTST